MPESRPYLTLEQRAEYLVRRGYIDDFGLSDKARDFLEVTNFHYFLGYARNFRKLRREGAIVGDLRIDRVIHMVELDHAVSSRLFQALRTVEWRLRSVLVDRHCELFPPQECFLNSEHFTVMNSKSTPVEAILRDQIIRSREPFVLGAFEAHAQEIGQKWTGDPRSLSDADQFDVMRGLPIWSVVDGWSLGLLERVVAETKPALKDSEQRWLWKDVASAFNVSNQVFQTQMGSIIVLRNLVAHHSRLWMRPTAVSPKKPKLYAKRLRDSDDKAMYVAWLTLASFLKSGGGDQELISDLDAIIAQDPLYEHGVKRPLTSAAL